MVKLNFEWSSLDPSVTHGSNFKNYQKITVSKNIVYHVQPGKLIVNMVDYSKTEVTENLGYQ